MKKGFTFALISGILDIIFALCFFVGGAYLALSGFVFSANPIVVLATLGTLYAIGIILAVLGIAAIGIGVVFLVFGIKTLVLVAARPENYKKGYGRLLGYAITETVFFGLSLFAVIAAIQDSNTYIVIFIIAMFLFAVNFVFKYVAYALARSMAKIKI